MLSGKWAFGPPIWMKVRLPVMLSAAKHLLFLQPQKQILHRCAPQNDSLDDSRGSGAKDLLLCAVCKSRSLVAALLGMTGSLLLPSCSRAPSFDILGSFFPAWLVCLAIAILLTFLARWVLLRLHIAVVVPILVYPSLTFLFAFALWLIFFR
jgi:YtcA family